ncbi:MAG TPA: tRNA uridine-5-carboxymethylaminomethyl(34) synthesis enzyme MnmG, partial [Candidatus Omnitrophica bacterium]|nr:tRNA uridine-5-carboxymethylaminomethyl(34) synthesis enzyme MnmG [Candidatus Omnitrophota bacterium]
PLFSKTHKKIFARGVRYCPSLEDKVVKFPHHKRHQIFLEPEGKDSDEYYPNGLSTSLPIDVQDKFIRTVPGLERVKINRYGYGIEHDVIDATQIFPTLETKLVKNLYTAGQINGTTGYEEAAAQGLIAGINAVLNLRKKPPLILDRTTSYIGVLIDDLVTKGTNEPYRMFTSRVEYRLIIREDNTDLRLRKIGYEVGLVGEKLYRKTQRKKKEIEDALNYLKQNRISVDRRNISLYQYLKRPEIKIQTLKERVELNYPQDVLQEVEIEAKYAGFIQRQLAEVKRFKDLEKIRIPENIDYNKIPSLSAEIKEKLSEIRPLNLGQANRISGVTPAAITILMVYLKKIKNQNGREPTEIL